MLEEVQAVEPAVRAPRAPLSILPELRQLHVLAAGGLKGRYQGVGSGGLLVEEGLGFRVFRWRVLGC